MQQIYGDLHIHIGEALGKPVKITASRRLTLHSIIFEAAPAKGLDMVGVVDAGSTLVSAEIETMLENRELQELNTGGMMASNGILLIPSVEAESREGVHLIIFLPSLQSIHKYQQYTSKKVSNRQLSTQKVNLGVADFIDLSLLLEGIFCPAHAFTPHKGIYGMWTDRLQAKLGRDLEQIKVLELGLSADSAMADMLSETRRFAFLSNSDAHSGSNVGREYNLFCMKNRNFNELRLCVERKEGRKIMANYGMDPLLGKYHRTYCPQCNTTASGSLSADVCRQCGSTRIIMGVYDRILAIGDFFDGRHPLDRPAYNYRVPLKDIPGVGPKTLSRLNRFFRNEIELVENADLTLVAKTVGNEIAEMIGQMRNGRLDIVPGGGGHYGKVRKHTGSQNWSFMPLG